MKPQILTETNFSKLKNLVKKSEKPIIFSSEDDDLNRKVIEKLPIDILLINQSKRKDFQKQRNSGLNQVLAKIAKDRNKTSTSTAKNVSRKNQITIGINLDEIINSKGKAKSEILARIRQNVKICNKNKIQMIFISPSGIKRDSYGLKALGLVLGMPTQMLKGL